MMGGKSEENMAHEKKKMDVMKREKKTGDCLMKKTKTQEE